MKRNLVSIACIASLGLAMACSKDDSKGTAAPTVKRQSKLGASSQVGVFPDGKKAQPLSGDELKSVTVMTEGVFAVNSAVSGASGAKDKVPGTGNRISDVKAAKIQLVKAALDNPFIRAAISNPRDLISQVAIQARVEQGKSDKLKSEIQNKDNGCLIKDEGQPQQSGDQNNMRIFGTMTSSITGTNCPVNSRTAVDLDINAAKIGELYAKFGGALNVDSKTSLVKVADQNEMDFKSESFKGSVTGEAVGTNKGNNEMELTEAAMNADFAGNLLTVKSGNLGVRFLADAYILSQDKRQNVTMSASLVLNAPSIDLLLQLYVIANDGQSEPTVKMYLNGQELDMSGASRE